MPPGSQTTTKPFVRHALDRLSSPTRLAHGHSGATLSPRSTFGPLTLTGQARPSAPKVLPGRGATPSQGCVRTTPEYPESRPRTPSCGGSSLPSESPCSTSTRLETASSASVSPMSHAMPLSAAPDWRRVPGHAFVDVAAWGCAARAYRERVGGQAFRHDDGHTHRHANLYGQFARHIDHPT